MNRRNFFIGLGISIIAASMPAIVMAETNYVQRTDRQILDSIKSQIADSLREYFFEPNDELTRFKLIASTNEILQPYLTNREVTKFFVICDKRNNTSEIEHGNSVVIDVYVKIRDNEDYYAIKLTLSSTNDSTSVNYE